MMKISKSRSSRPTDITWFVYRMGYATTWHISKVLFVPKRLTPEEILAGKIQKHFQLDSKQAVRHLKDLRAKKWLNYVEQLIKPDEARKPFVYYCTPTAYLKVLKGQERVLPPNVYDRAFNHHIKVRDLFTDILVSARLTGWTIGTFKSMERLEAEYQNYRPDWYFSMAIDEGNPFHYYLEVELARKEKAEWIYKLNRIKEYWESDYFKTTYKYYRIRWLITAPTEQRAAELKAWSEEAGAGPRFWFTHEAASTPETALSQPIWTLAGQQGKFVAAGTR